MNSVNLVGRLCREIEVRRTQDGTAVCSYSLAVKRPMVKDATDFPECVSWRQAAEFLAQYAHKGDWIAVSGALQSREWTDKEGKKHRAWEVVTTSVELLSGKKNDQGNNNASQIQSGPGGIGYAPQNAPQFQQGYQQPQYNQQGFAGYQQNPYPNQGFQAPHPQQGSFAPIEDDDAQLPF